MITRIEAYRYRCFQKVDIALENYQVLVGANGSGKSTLLDIPIFLGEMISARSIEAAMLRPTASRTRSRADRPIELIFNQKGTDFGVAIEAVLPDDIVDILIEQVTLKRSPKRVEEQRSQETHWSARIRYQMRFEEVDGALHFAYEALYLLPRDEEITLSYRELLTAERELPKRSPIHTVFRRERGSPARFVGERAGRQSGLSRRQRYALIFRPEEPALANPPAGRDQFPATHWLRELLSDRLCPYQLNLTTMHSAKASFGNRLFLAPDGSMLPWLVYDLRKRDKRAYEEWLEHVQMVLPGICEIESKRREDDGYAYLCVHYKSGLTVTSSGLSDGTLTILGLTILPYLQNLPPLIVIEEPENSLHPQAIESVLDSLTNVRDAQVLVSSHSPVVVAHTDLKDLLCLQQTPEEGSTVVRGDQHPRLQEWKGQPGLSTLFAAGILG